MNRHYSAVADRAGHRCEYCLAPEEAFNFPFEVEHITPTARSGSPSDDNLALACRGCNLFKSDEVEGTDPETGIATRLFHPRRDRWNAHFRIEIDSWEIIGQTDVGRATVIRLQLNRPRQLSARRTWAAVGLFP